VNSKPWYQSRILWLNTAAAGFIALEASFHLVQPLVPVNVYLAVATALPVLNAMLRVVTSTQLTLTATSKS
jgi:hypothetical protein